MNYYYDVIEVAKLANIWHGINFISRDGKVLKSTMDIELDAISGEYPEKFYIHPDSLDIFKPQAGDLVQDKYKEFQYVYQDHKGVGIDTNKGTASPDGCEIIQRQGKHFFMPIKEGV